MSDFIGVIFGVAIVGLTVLSWITHLTYTWAHDMLGLFIAGLIFPPFAVVHGLLILIGVI